MDVFAPFIDPRSDPQPPYAGPKRHGLIRWAVGGNRLSGSFRSAARL